MTTQTETGLLRLPAGAAPKARDAALVAGASLLVALSAQIALPLPFTPVPLTLQTLAVILVGAALGARRGTLAVLLYLVEGAAGLPVFAGGCAGAAYMVGPTGGYLAGFLAAAAVAGALAEAGWMQRPLRAAAAILAAEACIFLPGVLWLGAWTGAPRAAALGLAPFLPGEALKAAAILAALGTGFFSAAGRRGKAAARQG
jgi:biotin transport system substrate-specific component